MEKWFHVVSHNACWGFAINENNIVTDVAPIAFKNLHGKSVKDAEVRKWFTDNKLIVSEIKASINEQV